MFMTKEFMYCIIKILYLRHYKGENMEKILCYIYEEMADFEISLVLHRYIPDMEIAAIK